MATKFPPPAPERIVRLRRIQFMPLGHEQVIAPVIESFAAGAIGSETTVYRLLMAVKELHPALKQAHTEAAEERAMQLRERREMLENLNATSPTFIDYTPDGKPVSDGQQPLAEVENEAVENSGSAAAPHESAAAEEADDNEQSDESRLEEDEDFGPNQDEPEYDNLDEL